MISPLSEMPFFLAQRYLLPEKPFDLADGFAIALILMLFTVLGGVALVASRFRRREKRMAEEEMHALQELLGLSPPGKPVTSAKKSQSVEQQRPSWERDGDWWKQDS